MSECREASPVHHILLLTGAPISGQETVPAANDFGIKVSSQFRPVVCQPSNAEVATEV